MIARLKLASCLCSVRISGSISTQGTAQSGNKHALLYSRLRAYRVERRLRSTVDDQTHSNQFQKADQAFHLQETQAIRSRVCPSPFFLFPRCRILLPSRYLLTQTILSLTHSLTFRLRMPYLTLWFDFRKINTSLCDVIARSLLPMSHSSPTLLQHAPIV